MSILKTEAVFSSETTVVICQTIQKCRNPGDDVMSLYNRRAGKEKNIFQGQANIQ